MFHCASLWLLHSATAESNIFHSPNSQTVRVEKFTISQSYTSYIIIRMMWAKNDYTLVSKSKGCIDTDTGIKC